MAPRTILAFVCLCGLLSVSQAGHGKNHKVDPRAEYDTLFDSINAKVQFPGSSSKYLRPAPTDASSSSKTANSTSAVSQSRKTSDDEDDDDDNEGSSDRASKLQPDMFRVFTQMSGNLATTGCQRDEDCAENNYVCSRFLNKCVAPSSNTSSCSSDADCKAAPASKASKGLSTKMTCNAGKCRVCGPQVCNADSDCCAGEKCDNYSGFLAVSRKRCRGADSGIGANVSFSGVNASVPVPAQSSSAAHKSSSNKSSNITASDASQSQSAQNQAADASSSASGSQSNDVNSDAGNNNNNQGSSSQLGSQQQAQQSVDSQTVSASGKAVQVSSGTNSASGSALGSNSSSVNAQVNNNNASSVSSASNIGADNAVGSGAESGFSDNSGSGSSDSNASVQAQAAGPIISGSETSGNSTSIRADISGIQIQRGQNSLVIPSVSGVAQAGQQNTVQESSSSTSRNGNPQKVQNLIVRFSPKNSGGSNQTSAQSKMPHGPNNYDTDMSRGQR